MPSGVRLRRGFAVAAVIAGLAAAPAAAQQSQDLSSVAQYSEGVPTSTGGSGGGVAQLPASVLDRIWLEGGKDAPLLEAIATQERFGAPQNVRAGRSSRGASPSAASAALSAVTDSDSPRVAQLLLVLFATTAAALIAAAARARRGRRSVLPPA